MVNSSKFESVINASLEQFSENINHRQKLFIQFFLGVVVVIVGYTYIYSTIEQNAFFWKAYREGENRAITSYPISSLIGSYIVAQIVLILLARFVLSSGYSFRKYQVLVYHIRRDAMGSEFSKYFGEGNTEFSPYNKRGLFSKDSYLPEFETIFFVFIWGLQILLFISFSAKLSIFEHPVLLKITEPQTVLTYLGYKIKMIKFWIILASSIPVFATCFFQFKYYTKYLMKVNLRETEHLPDGKTNTAFSENDGLRRYQRKVSLAFGYLMLGYLFFIIQNAFLILSFNEKNVLYNWELILIYIIAIGMYGGFLYNYAQAFIHYKLRNPILIKQGEKALLSIIAKAIKQEFFHEMMTLRKTEWAKKNRTINWFIILLFILVIIATTSLFIFIGFRNDNISFIWMGICSFMIFVITTAIILRIKYNVLNKRLTK